MGLTKSMAYDSPVYQAVLTVPLTGTSTAVGAQSSIFIAGANTYSTKFVAFTNMLLKSVTTSCTGTNPLGTGTATTFTLGNVGTGNAPAILRVTNNGTTHSTFATGTYQMLGAYVLPPGAASLSTAGAVITWTPQTAYTTAIGTSGASVNAQTSVNNWALVNGGIPLQAGDTVQFYKGADGTEVINNPVLELVIQPLANITP